MPPWTPIGAATLPKMRTEATNDAKRMLWLKTSIAPMIQRLKGRYTVREIREVLGLQYEHPFYKEKRPGSNTDGTDRVGR